MLEPLMFGPIGIGPVSVFVKSLREVIESKSPDGVAPAAPSAEPPPPDEKKEEAL